MVHRNLVELVFLHLGVRRRGEEADGADDRDGDDRKRADADDDDVLLVDFVLTHLLSPPLRFVTFATLTPELL